MRNDSGANPTLRLAGPADLEDLLGLFRQLIPSQTARQEDCCKLALTTGQTAPAVFSLYERAGFRMGSKTVMDLRFD